MTAPSESAAALLEPSTALARPDPARRFCALWLAGVVGLVAAIGAFNAAVDPYLVFGSPRMPGFNAAKPETETHTRLAKDHLLPRLRPAGLMLGSSKVDIGLDPASPNWPADARPAFNYGEPGTGLGDALANLRHALSLGPVRRVLVLLDIQEIIGVADAAPPPAAAVSPLAAWLDLEGNWRDMLLATLSLDALRASLATVAAQHRRDVVDLSPDGATGDGGFRRVVAADGYDTLFRQKDIGLTAQFADLARAVAARPQAGFAGLDSLSELIALCRQRGIAFDLALSPYHADLLDLLDRAGLWPRYEQAKRELARRVAVEGGGAVRLWDFLGYDAYSTEPVPGAARHGGMRWFWETDHFTHALGEKLLATVYRGAGDFGAPLTPETVEAHLAAQAAAKAAYQAGAADDRDRLARLGR